METDFSLLAPRYGTRPLTNSCIGNSTLSGGAFNWGNIWNGIKNIGQTLKTWSDKAWNSSSGQMLREKLKKTQAQEKLVDTLASGVHGALDIASQHINEAIAQKLKDRPKATPETALGPGPAPAGEENEEDVIVEGPAQPLIQKEPALVVEMEKNMSSPPSYEEAIREQPPPPVPHRRETQSLPPPPSPPPPSSLPTSLTPLLSSPPPVHSERRRKWQNTLNEIVGVGLKGIKRRRCY